MVDSLRFYIYIYIEIQCSTQTSLIWNNDIKMSTILNANSIHICKFMDNTNELQYIRMFTFYSFSAKKACSVLGNTKLHEWLATGRWFSQGIPASSINKTDRHDITGILLKVTVSTIQPIQINCTFVSIRHLSYYSIYIFRWNKILKFRDIFLLQQCI